MTSAPLTLPQIRRAGLDDAALLSSLAAVTFADTFAADNDPRDMAEYIAAAFSEPMQRAELEDPSRVVLFAERNGEPVGYAMLHAGNAPPCVSGPAPIEIARLYAARQAIGSSVGSALMQACLHEAAERGHRTIWLGVWEHNARAIAFYRRWGFTDAGSQHFQLGRDRQTDRVMTRPVRLDD